ncbi:hypothetical protein T12_5248 [Trichinella patagoniensis]|uniref:Uncharacterized protein n=1 Tax=Trichinella patagoniensis TaxID=990121 RepID=A0A0V0ZYM3_9BILA|nr:hypothetical protein T12_5248 [Trichinella patagoniensis]
MAKEQQQQQQQQKQRQQLNALCFKRVPMTILVTMIMMMMMVMVRVMVMVMVMVMVIVMMTLDVTVVVWCEEKCQKFGSTREAARQRRLSRRKQANTRKVHGSNFDKIQLSNRRFVQLPSQVGLKTVMTTLIWSELKDFQLLQKNLISNLTKLQISTTEGRVTS